MSKLFLLRHLKSQWNEDNRFAGWTDGPLKKNSYNTAKDYAQQFMGLNIDKAYSSSQFRNMDTIAEIFDNIPGKYPIFMHIDGGKMEKWGKINGLKDFLPVYTTEKLNERHYGSLQGLNKQETKEQYGEEQVQLWRRSYKVAPPSGESGKDVYNRVAPFFKKYIEKDLKEGKDVLVVASHNSLRAVVKYIENISDEQFGGLEIPFGALVKYEFDGKLYKKL